ncbi:MAG: hypothetical protein JST00_42980 [Deltaproteobacteria bacterium]|nr:hypothetical protein [Deltaproteobacteria bacterium]
MQRARLALTLFAFVGAFTASALGGTRAWAGGQASARLVYTVDDPSCPSEEDLRRMVAKRLGYDPFRADAAVGYRVQIVKRGARVEAKIASEGGAGAAGRRELADARCDALAESVASTLAIAIDPVAASAPPPPPPPPPPPRDTSDPLPPPSSEPPPRVSTSLSPSDHDAAPGADGRVRLAIRGDLVAGLGLTASVAMAARLGAAARFDRFSIGGEGIFGATPSSAAVTNLDRIDFTTVGIAGTPCFHSGVFEGCLVVALASVSARAVNVVRPATSGKVVFTGALRGGVDIPLGKAVSFRANAELGAPFVRVDYVIDGQSVWTTSVVVGAVGVGLAGIF